MACQKLIDIVCKHLPVRSLILKRTGRRHPSAWKVCKWQSDFSANGIREVPEGSTPGP